VTDDPVAPSPAQLALDVHRVADRLRSLSAARLAAPAPAYPSIAAAGRQAAQALADAAQGYAEAGAAQPPRWRTIPALSDFAVGDMVAVTGRDLIDAAAAASPDQQVWTRSGTRAAVAVLAEVAALLRDVRRLA
jgi:hypothetical protein